MPKPAPSGFFFVCWFCHVWLLLRVGVALADSSQGVQKFHTFSSETLDTMYRVSILQPIAAKRSDRVPSDRAAHRRFLQQARLGKDKATAGGSGIEKIVCAKASSALPLDGIRQRERDM